MIKFIRNTAITVMAILMSVGLANAVPTATMRSCPSPTCIVGVILIELDKPMGSGRIYSTAEVQKAVDAWRGKRVRGRLVVDNYLSESTEEVNRKELAPNESSHVVSNLRILDGMLVCDVEILPSPTGGVLMELVRLGVADFRPYGAGSNDSSGRVYDYELIRVDVFPQWN
jgi:hypothetical protein